MPRSKKGSAKAPVAKKAAPAAKKAVKKQGSTKSVRNPLIEARPKTYGIGGDFVKGRDLRRFVRWPKYVRLQRQKRILASRLSVPPAVAQFSHTLDQNSASQLFNLLNKYKPETRQEKKQRLKNAAAAKVAGKEVQAKKPTVVKYGINHVTGLIEQKKAQLVVIAHDVDPIELVVWLPALCRRKGVPYCVVKSKARLGQVVHKKNATCLAITAVNQKDQNTLASLATSCKESFNDNKALLRTWGGQQFGVKARHSQARKAKIQRAEELKRAKI